MSSNNDLKDKVISLRKKGKSYNEIRKELGIKSKGTISYWLKNIKLPEESRKLLEKNNELSHKRGLFIANDRKKKEIIEVNKTSYDEGIRSIKDISKYELLLIGSSLYWAEGSKSERATPSLSFSNSDPFMIVVYLRFIREILKIPEEKIRAGIHIYPNISENEAKKYWSTITKLPENRFYIVTQISKSSQGKRPFNILPNGTLAIKVNSRIPFYKVKGMINGIYERLNT